MSGEKAYETLLFEVREQVATVTLNRPDVRNAFGAGMGPELDDAFRRCDEDDGIRAVVLTGTPPAFCSGADLARGGETFGKVDTTTFDAAGLRFPPWDVRKPVIGAINGHAIGVGMTLAIQCDLRFMAADAKYGVVQTQRGVMGDAFVHWSLPRIVGMANAAEILLTGKTFDGHEMQRLGVASRVLAAEEVLPAAWEYAREMAATTAPMSVAFSKRVLWASFDLDRDDVNHLETVLHHHLMGSPDAKEGVMAFLERRVPQWEGSVSENWPEVWPGEEVPGDEESE
jgi:enoyl-CoA hydratase/carnithine racemase